jgi:putative ABC transport system permease protein
VVRIGNRNRAEQHGIRDTEDRDHGAESGAEHDDDGDRQGAASAQAPIGGFELSVADVRAWRAAQTSLTQIELFGSVNWGELHIMAHGEPFAATMKAVSTGFFDVLGARPILGRTFQPRDDLTGTRRTLILSGDLWRRRFASDPRIVGKVFTVHGRKADTPYEVVGVMPPDFRVPAGADVWIALGPALSEAVTDQKWPADEVHAMYGIARLQPGVTSEHAAAELSTIEHVQEQKQGAASSASRIVVTPLVSYLVGPARPALFATGGAAAVLLLIGCANATGLLLVQSARRRREVAICVALGAGRWRIVRHRLCESILLSTAAGVVGVVLAYASFGAIVGLVPIEVPRLDQAAIDVRTILFAVVVSTAIALVVGLVPAWRDGTHTVSDVLQQRSETGASGASAVRMRKLLAGTQIAAAVVLLTGASLFTRSFVTLLRVDLGFVPQHVLTFHLGFPESSYAAIEPRRALVDAVLTRARQLPHVSAAGAVYLRPFAHGSIGSDTSVIAEGQPLTPHGAASNPIVNWEVATPDYFSALGIGVLRGRVFTDRDREDAPPVVIVSDALARWLWPGQNPLGRRILTYGARGNEKHPGWQTVVGVVGNARYREIEAPRFDVYLPYRQAPAPVEDFVVRVAGDPTRAVPQLRAAVAGIAPGVTIESVSTMTQIVDRVRAPWRFNTIVVSVFNVLALTFAAVGLGTVVAYAVAQRRREIGVRMALGAQARDVILLLVRDTAAMTSGGLIAGLLAAWMLRRLVAGMLFGVTPGDAAAFSAAAVVLAIAALLAAWIPAREAVRIDPAVALSGE